MNTPQQLEKDGSTLEVGQVNHREYVLNGYRYFFGWDSTVAGKCGWILYKTEREP
jgi:hypothetical protein